MRETVLRQRKKQREERLQKISRDGRKNKDRKLRRYAVMILSFRTDRSGQTLWIQIIFCARMQK